MDRETKATEACEETDEGGSGRNVFQARRSSDSSFLKNPLPGQEHILMCFAVSHPSFPVLVVIFPSPRSVFAQGQKLKTD